MSKWQTLLVKEIVHLFRDTKTIVQTVVVPTFITPLLIGAVIWYISSIAVDEGKKTYDVAVYDEVNTELTVKLQESDRLNIVLMDSIDQVIDDVTNDNSEIGISFGSDFTSQLENNLSGEVTIYSKNLDNFSQAQGIVSDVIDDYDDQIRNERLNNLNVDENFINPITVLDKDLTTNEEFAGSIIGGILAFLFIVYIMSGSMYPAIDLGAGEKERGSLETLLSSPATKFEITMGKLLVVSLTGIVSGLVSVLGISSSLFFIDKIPVQIQETILELINPFMIFSIIILMIPIAIFFASMLLSISFYARSFKEAQSLMGPLNMVIIVPLFLSLGPGMEMDHATALMPLINVGLLTKEILAGSVELIYFIETLFSLLFCAAIGIWFSVYWFKKENTIFRV